MSLAELGWDAGWADTYAPFAKPKRVPARVTCQRRMLFRVHAEDGAFDAAVAGSLHHRSRDREGLPVVGDWVVFEPRTAPHPGWIRAVLPRRGCFRRSVPGPRTQVQVVAANLDVALIVCGLDGGRSLNVRRIERFVSLCEEGGVAPVVLLNKADLATDADAQAAAVRESSPRVPVHVTSALTGYGLDAVRALCRPGLTLALLGVSGSGKSALTNALLGEERQRVGAVREEDGKGRHTTTERELVILPDGAALIDNPGLRELQMWAEAGAAEAGFPDVVAFAGGCRFRDCRHADEPGCAVRAAVEEGRLDAGRWASFQSLRDEVTRLGLRRREHAQRESRIVAGRARTRADDTPST